MSGAPQNKVLKPNKQQQKAIETVEGPLLIIAGPGSGKTFTLVERVAYMISEKQIPPKNILLATFTKKAAGDLKTKISGRLKEIDTECNLNEMYLGTIHSICLKIIDTYREYTNLEQDFVVFDDFDQKYLLYQNLQDFYSLDDSGLILKKHNRQIDCNTLAMIVNKMTEEVIDPNELLKEADPRKKVLGEFHLFYKHLLKKENAVDYATIQLEMLHLLNNNPAILRKLQDKIKYLLIDEYQDTNTVQELILLKLAEKTGNICVVGDDDQGLYRFRGATVRNILKFPENFPGGCKKIRLTTNYRSHPQIIDFCNRWMEKGNYIWERDGVRYRHEKKIVPRKDIFPEVPAVLRVSAVELQQFWHAKVLLFLQTLKEKGTITDWNQVAFLFRSVRLKGANDLRDFLEENGIPVYAPRSDGFFKRPEIVYLTGAFLLMFPEFKPRPFDFKVTDYYKKCISEILDQLADPLHRSLAIWLEKVGDKHSGLAPNETTDYGYLSLFYQLLEFPLFNRFLESAGHSSVVDRRPAYNYAIFSEILEKFEYLNRIRIISGKNVLINAHKLFNIFLPFLIKDGINEYEDALEFSPGGCVAFMTIHQSKGLEFPVVVVDSLWARPKDYHMHIDELLSDHLQRERYEPLELRKYLDFWRLYYTAFSRAQNLLVLSCVEKYVNRPPSQYFHAIYKESVPFDSPDVALTKIKPSSIKPARVINEYSYGSHLMVYESCPQRYLYFRELGFTPRRTAGILYGKLVHRSLQDIHNLFKNDVTLNNKMVTDLFNTNYKSLSSKERVYLAPATKKGALNEVLRYFKNEKDIGPFIKETEVRVALTEKDFILTGVIDLILERDGKIEIVDFKTGEKPTGDHLWSYRKQLNFYAHLLEQNLGLEVSRMHLYFTSEKTTNPYVSFVKKPESLSIALNALEKSVRKIEAKDFRMPNEISDCSSCDMRYYCKGIALLK